jgi:hypothetical protein
MKLKSRNDVTSVGYFPFRKSVLDSGKSSALAQEDPGSGLSGTISNNYMESAGK